MPLDRSSILAIAHDLPREEASLGAHGTVFIRTLTGKERDAFEQSCFVQLGAGRCANLANVRARLLVLVICDEDGKRIFEDKDADALGDLPASILDPLFAQAQRLSAITKADVETMAGN